MVRAMTKDASPQPPVPVTETATETIDFGAETVPRAEKARRVRAVFDSVASRYDVMNDLMSLGVHRLWKAAAIDRLAPRPYAPVLDVAGGTGDMAFRIADRMRGQTPVTVCDANAAMVAEGRRRAKRLDWGEAVTWTVGDAEKLPFPESSFAGYVIAFGLRNVTDRMAALREARRVLRPGGRFLCLEFSRVDIPGFDRLYAAWSDTALPAMGQIVAKDRESYHYLKESIRRFPPQDELAGMIAEAGFARVQYSNLTGGVAAMHTAWRL